MIKCPVCRSQDIDKGRAPDSRRAYRCNSCGKEWTQGLQGKAQKWSEQRQVNQFKDRGIT